MNNYSKELPFWFNFKETIIILLILTIVGIFLFKWSNTFAITTLEDTRMSRAHQVIASFKSYYYKPYQWLKDIKKNKIEEFSLGYILPTPLMFLLGDIPGFKLSHIIVSLITVYLIYLILRKQEGNSFINSFVAIILLLTSYGFVFISGFTILDQFAFMFFFAFVYFYFKDKLGVASLCFLLAVFSKDPRIMLASIPAIFIFIVFNHYPTLKLKRTWLYIIGFLTVFLLIQKITQGAELDLFSSGMTGNKNSNLMLQFLKSFRSFKYQHFYGIFITAPLLLITGILGLTEKVKKSAAIKMLLLCFIFFILLYFTSPTSGSHYIYFTYLFLTVFSINFLKKINVKSKLAIILISVVILFFSIQDQAYFKPLKVNDLKRLKTELLPYSNQGFILSHAFDWGLYFHNQRWGNIWDWEWSGSSLKINKLPEYIENNIQLVAVEKSFLDIFFDWNRSDEFELYRNHQNWFFFIPADKNNLNNEK